MFRNTRQLRERRDLPGVHEALERRVREPPDQRLRHDDLHGLDVQFGSAVHQHVPVRLSVHNLAVPGPGPGDGAGHEPEALLQAHSHSRAHDEAVVRLLRPEHELNLSPRPAACQ